MSKPLHVGQECWADIGGVMVEAVVADRIEVESLGYRYTIRWAVDFPTGSEVRECKNLHRDELFPTWDEAYAHVKDRLSYWERALERLELIPEDEPDAETLEREEQDAWNDAEADAAMREERAGKDAA